MRASIGFRAGPLYVGTGNLLKSSRRAGSGANPVLLLVIYMFVAVWLLLALVFWILPRELWRVIRRPEPDVPMDAEPRDAAG